MNTKARTQEQVSALADGELAGGHIDIAMAALRDPEQRAGWDVYHHIGDVLRSEDMAFEMSDGFSARFAARLEAEPAILAPMQQRVEPQERSHIMKRFGVPGMAAAAAVATVMFVTTPLVMRKDGAPGGVPVVALANEAASAQVQTVAAGSRDAVMLRDSRIDEYLMAHQRFSPSVFGSAQYARSATFAGDSNK